MYTVPFLLKIHPFMCLQVCCAALSSQHGPAGPVAQSNIKLYNNCMSVVVFLQAFPEAAAAPARFSSVVGPRLGVLCLGVFSEV